MMDNKKVILFDMDGVLTQDVSSWRTIHKHFGVDNGNHFALYLKGEIDCAEFIKKDIALWPKNTHISELEKIFCKCNLMPGAKETIKALRKKGYQKIGILSAGIDILANRIAKILNLDFVFAEGLETDKKGYLTGEGIARVELLEKNKVIADLSEEFKIPTSEFVAVGDSKYDASMLKTVGLGIAFNPTDEEIKKFADIVVEGNDMRKILEHL